jgi:hypothetical protein
VNRAAVLLWLLIQVVPGPIHAQPGCFGSVESRKANAARRQRVLDFVDEDDGGITVAHTSNTWGEPRALRVPGIRLLEVGPAGATVSVSVSPETKGCRSGHRQLRVDDALPGQLRVLALLPRWRVMLLERRGKLHFVSVSGGRLPRWLMAWRVDGTLAPDIPATPWSPPPPPEPPPLDPSLQY